MHLERPAGPATNESATNESATNESATNESATAARRRGAALENAILDAAWEVLAEQGYPGLTYETVAARAGTSRTVLYRRWPHHDDLLVATLKRFWAGQPVIVPDTGSLREDAIGFLRDADVGRARMLTLLSVQIAEHFRRTGTSPDRLRSLMHPDGPSPFETIVARAVARNELVAAPRSPRVVNLAFDLYRHDVFMTMQPVTEAAILHIVDEVWLPLLAAATAVGEA